MPLTPVEPHFDDPSVQHSTAAPPIITQFEGLAALLYFGAYFAYLFWHQENEMWHWLNLVLLPLIAVWLFRRLGKQRQGFRKALATIGLVRGRLLNGMGWALLIGCVLIAAQFLLSWNRDKFIELFLSGEALWRFPLGFVLMLFLAGTTEEVFFRGFLQTRLTVLMRNVPAAIILTSVCFAIYHLPYSYYNPNWPSHGNWGHALQLSLTQAVPMGILFGIVYYKSRNLLTVIVLHAMNNALPAMLINISFGGGK